MNDKNQIIDYTTLKTPEIFKKSLKLESFFKILEQQSKVIQNAFNTNINIQKSIFDSISYYSIISTFNNVNYNNLSFKIVIKKLEEYSFSNIIGTLNNTLNLIKENLLKTNIISSFNLSGLDSDMLNKYYWVIPFEYEYSKVKYLSKYKTRFKFEKYMLKYFNITRIKKIFFKIKKDCINKDKKELIKQVEKAFFNEDYAICITSLITMLDGLSLQLIDSNSDRQHLSYKAISDMLNYINDNPMPKYGYELYLKVDILNNFYMKLYDNTTNLKNSNKKLLSRHINSHGVKYLNNKINVLRLLNAIYFCQLIINETNLKEKFKRKKKKKILL